MTIQEIKTYQDLMLGCLEKYTQIALNLDRGDYTSKMNAYEMAMVIWQQYLYWREKMEKAKLEK